ncbi:hypothetical protein ACFYO1_34655 [Nocardia sp. NPDC006044]|uniref:hypothetical protein n=1 Tax=Nocardia sp. NPDC006044 TaxID=3364306 RepID=UPI0036A21B7A
MTAFFEVLGAAVLSFEAEHPATSSAAPSATAAALIDRVFLRLMHAYSRNGKMLLHNLFTLANLARCPHRR